MTRTGLDLVERDECDALLRTATLGRLGFRHGDMVLVLPVYYALDGGDVVFRTAPGAKLDAAVLGARVAFEVDDETEGWSVLVIGHASEIRDDAERRRVRDALVEHWPTGTRELLVRVAAEHVSGRRLSRLSGRSAHATPPPTG
jgi:nitroimidazol reductase NimA-like FMN-containing flavoprotein (pyridoxamine 5'-phosphate oxidase superfamily)